MAIAKAAVARFELSTDGRAVDTTNFDTHIATGTPGELARRGHAKSKRRDLRVVGLGLLVSETGPVPLLYRPYAENGSDQRVLEACLAGLRELHEALDAGEGRRQPQRTLVRDGGFWRRWTSPALTASSRCRSATAPPSSRCRWRPDGAP